MSAVAVAMRAPVGLLSAPPCSAIVPAFGGPISPPEGAAKLTRNANGFLFSRASRLAVCWDFVQFTMSEKEPRVASTCATVTVSNAASAASSSELNSASSVKAVPSPCFGMANSAGLPAAGTVPSTGIVPAAGAGPARKTSPGCEPVPGPVPRTF
jgi:hypothetical protein